MNSIIKFLLSSIASLLIVFALGWTTSLAGVMYAASLSLLTLAMLPFVLILIGILLPFLALAIFLGGLVVQAFGGGGGGGGDADGVIDGTIEGFRISRYGWRIMEPYYSRLAKTRHPLFWGTLTGVFLGAVLLWGVVTYLVLPGEKRTVEILAATRDLVIQSVASQEKVPPAANNQLLFRDLGIDQPGPVLDGFDRPLIFEANEESFRLRSLGFDGKQGKDDFCIAGKVEIPVKGRLNQLKALIKKLPKLDIEFEKGKWKIKKVNLQFAGKLINELRCSEQ